jgi:hypothetical protein
MMAREGMINSEMMEAAEGLDNVDVSGVTGILEMVCITLIDTIIHHILHIHTNDAYILHLDVQAQ